MSDAMILSLFSLILVVLLVTGAWEVRTNARQLRAWRGRVTLLQAALWSVAGTCYRWDGEAGMRIDGKASDTLPLSLAAALAKLSDDDRGEIERLLRRLSEAGAGFSTRVVRADDSAEIEFSGHHLTAEGHPPIDLVWVADVSRQAAIERERHDGQGELARLRVVLDHLPIPVWWQVSGGARRVGNRQFEALAGIEDAAQALNQGAAAAGGPVHSMFEAPAKIGKRLFELFEVPLAPGEAAGFGLDQSAAHQLQRELDRLAIGHQQVLQTIDVAIAIWGPDTRLLFNNAAFERLWGLDHDWLATEPSLNEVLDTLRRMRALPELADFRKFKAEQAGLFLQNDPRREDLLHLPDDRTVRLKIAPHPFGGLTFTYEDVTDRLALERSFNTLTEVQRETLDQLFEGIAVFGSDGRLKLWNPIFRTMWRLNEAELEARPHITTVIDRTRPQYPAHDWQALRATMVEQVTSHTAFATRIERPDESVIEVNGISLPDGNMLLSFLDVSDTVRVQRALREKEEALDTANRLKSEFVAHVSYELRTPLNAVIGFSEILANQYFGPLNERQLDYSRSILSSSQRLLSLINDILDLAAIEAGQLDLARDMVDVHALLASVLPMTRERAETRDLVVEFDCPTDLGFVVADERRLRQVLYNLVSNALKFTPAQGKLRLGARRHGREVALIVEDTGVGIAPNRLNAVFERFERAHSTRAVGAGLGLPLVKSFIELHGGRVEIQSTPNQGTRVECFLPSEPPDTRAGDAAAALPASVEALPAKRRSKRR